MYGLTAVVDKFHHSCISDKTNGISQQLKEDERMKSPEPQTAGQSSLKFLRSQALQSPPFHFAISIYIKINGSGSMYPDGNTFTSHHCIHPLGSPCLLDRLLKRAEIICSIFISILVCKGGQAQNAVKLRSCYLFFFQSYNMEKAQPPE